MAKSKETWPKKMHLEEHLVSLPAVAEGLDAVQPEVTEDVPVEFDITETETAENPNIQEIVNLQLKHFPEEF